jgi:DNA sulfur modification protein DndD
MLFTSLTIKNIGQYAGPVTFDLIPKSQKNGNKKPIILFGGKNGAGKTTFLQALKLCLYGNLSFGTRLSKVEYETSIKELIHTPKSNGKTIDHAEIVLEFKHSDAGVESLYQIVRIWTITPSKSINESVKILKNGERFKEVSKIQWQDFINSIIPLPLTTLFFFDGEQIQHLANTNGHEGLSEAVSSLLGFDLIHQLGIDLDYLFSEEAKTNPDHQLSDQLTEIDRELKKLEKQLKLLKEDQANLNSKRGLRQGQLSKVEMAFKQKGGILSEMRDENEKNKIRIEESLGRNKSEIREIASGSFPFSIVPELMNEVEQQLNREREIKEQRALFRFFEKDLKSNLADILDKELGIANTQGKQKKQIVKNVYNSLVEQVMPDMDLKDKPLLHDFSNRQEQRFLTIIKETQNDIPKKTKRLTNEIAKLEKEWQSTLQMVLQAPTEDNIQSMLDEIKQLQSEIFIFDNHLKQISDDIQTCKKSIEENKRAKERINASIVDSDKSKNKIKLISKSKTVLEKYKTVLKQKKISLLETELKKCWHLLNRKSELVSNVKIDPDTFEVVLYGANGQPKGKDKLSAGEKQIYAIAMLWALGRISGRPLPVIIDTPLGRLDSDHRTNLVENYFPFASHQVIILSTDTELDKKYSKSLETSVSHAYHLNYNQKKGETIIEEGYFW